MRKAFTLVEMLVVIGIIAVLVAASIGGFAGMTRAAENKKCQELVANTATALTFLFQKKGMWPMVLRDGNAAHLLDDKAARALAAPMSLTTDGNGKLAGLDRLGLVTPWAAAVVKRRGSSASLGDVVPGGGTVEDHLLRYAIDDDGDGIIRDVNVGGESVSVRATAIVWSCGKDGKNWPYSKGIKKGCSYSWTPGQTRGVK